MASLETKYMGLKLENPIVVGACSLSKSVDTIKEIEQVGAGALVMESRSSFTGHPSVPFNEK